MAIRWLPAVTVALWLGGCGFENAPPPDPSPQPRTADDPVAVPHPPAVEKASPAVAPKPAAKPQQPAKPPERTAEKKPVPRTTDDFGFSLIIVIEAPEVPKELLGPSPPIQEPPAPAPKPPAPKPAAPPKP